MAAAFDQIAETALDWHRSGAGAALATVIETWGSAPRPAGSQLAISGLGEMAGSVSGGCVEGAVVTEGLAALADGRGARVLTYGVSDENAFAAGLACGGRIRILLEPVGQGATALSPDLLAELVAQRAAHVPVAMVTDLQDFSRQLLRAGQDASVDAALRGDQSGVDEAGRLIAVHNPPLRLIIVGAVHIAQALIPMAQACGYACTLVDPRTAFATQTRFPDVDLRDDWPDEALAQLAPDPRTAIVTLTHDPKLDDPAICFALQSPAFYLGCLGSRKTHAARLERLAANGVPPDDLARIHAPVGLAIGAKTPAEIALSIMAQITECLRRPQV